MAKLFARPPVVISTFGLLLLGVIFKRNEVASATKLRLRLFAFFGVIFDEATRHLTFYCETGYTWSMRLIKTSDGREILLPKNDFLFKLIFGNARNEKLLKSFLRALLDLPDDEFGVVFLDTRLNPDFVDDKLCVLDIRIKTKTGKQIDVEMQVAGTAGMFERVCVYQAKMLNEQIGEGEWYGNVKKVISIIVADYRFIDGGDEKRYHHCYRMHDSVDDTYFGDVEEIHVLELPKLPEDSDETPAWEWGKFIGAESEEDLDMVSAKNEVIKTAVKELYRVSSDADARRLYEMRERARMDEIGRAVYREQQAEARGEARKQEEFINLLQSGKNPAEILKMYGYK
jgi:predicted transposase/invertase (TIGR01784 family)